MHSPEGNTRTTGHAGFMVGALSVPCGTPPTRQSEPVPARKSVVLPPTRQPRNANGRRMAPHLLTVNKSRDNWLQHVTLNPGRCYDYEARLVSIAQAHESVLQWGACHSEETQQYISGACAAITAWLPQDLLQELKMFLVNPTAPSVLYIQGLPIDTPTPPTPTSSSGPAQLPVANLVAMGIAKLVGDPFTFAHKAHKQRSGLLTDLVPEPEKSLKNNAALAFHQDFPMCKYANAFLLFCVRGDSSRRAYTYVCSNRQLVAAMDPADIAVLRSHPVRLIGPDGQPTNDLPFMRQPDGWLAVDGPTEDPVLRLYEPQFVDEGVSVAGATASVTRAYQRVAQLAEQLAVKVLLEPGDMLVINNQRCLHARAAYPALMDGTDRWLLRVIGVAQRGNLYRCPANPHPAYDSTNGKMPLEWPDLHIRL